MKCLVLSSGGIDSTTCIAIAVRDYGIDNVATVIFDYGQRHDKEIVSAKNVAQFYGVPYYMFDVKSLFQYSQCSLMKSGKPVVESSYAEQVVNGTSITSYVPFRNGLMLSVCATLAQSLWENEECDIFLGNHSSDFAYPDCSVKFVKKMSSAIFEGTYGWVKFISPLQNMTKAEVVKLGTELNVPYSLTWSCYEGNDIPCGRCASCIERINAFKVNGLVDPILYDNK